MECHQQLLLLIITSICDYNVEWKGWDIMFYNGQKAQVPESCVNQYTCGTYDPLWLSSPHPQLEDGVVTRQVCVSSWDGCCTYTSHPIRVKACPGNCYLVSWYLRSWVHFLARHQIRTNNYITAVSKRNKH